MASAEHLEQVDWLTAAVGRARYKQFYACSLASTVAAEAFVPKPTDIFVATYSKTGTTVLQMLLEMLRSRGDTSFDEITAVQPWVDFCHDTESTSMHRSCTIRGSSRATSVQLRSTVALGSRASCVSPATS